MPFISVDSGYEVMTAASDGSNPVEITINDTVSGMIRHFVNALATTTTHVVDNSVEITVNILSGGAPETVTFTPPDSSTRYYHVIVIRESP